MRDSYWIMFPLTIVNFNHFFIEPAPGSCIPTNESLFILLVLPTLAQTVQDYTIPICLFQNHPSWDIKKNYCIVSYYSDASEYNEYIVVLSAIRTSIFGFLDRRCTHRAIESTGVGSESYPFNSLSHDRFFRHFWGTASHTFESLRTTKCNFLVLQLFV